MAESSKLPAALSLPTSSARNFVMLQRARERVSIHFAPTSLTDSSGLGLSGFTPNSAFRSTPADSYLHTPKPSWYSKFLSCEDHQFALDLHDEHRYENPDGTHPSILLQDICWGLDLVGRNSSLTSLNLSHCSLDASVLASLALILKDNTSLRIVDIRDNPLLLPEDLQHFMLSIMLHNFTLSRIEYSLPKSTDIFYTTSIAEELEYYAGYIHARNFSIMSVRYPPQFQPNSLEIPIWLSI